MSPASSTVEQLLFTRDNLGKSNDSSGDTFSASVVHNSHLQASEERCVLDTDKTLSTHSPSPLTSSSQAMCQSSSADVSPALLSPSPSAANVTKDNDCKIPTLNLVSPDAIPNVGFAGVALPLPEPEVERPAMSRIPLLLLSGNAKTPPENLLHVAPVHFPCGSTNFGDHQTAPHPAVLGCSSCLATDTIVETETNDISDNAELSVTRHITYAEHKLPSGPTAMVSPSDAFDTTDLCSLDSDAHSTCHEISLCEYSKSRPYRTETPGPVPGPTLGPPLTPLVPVDTLDSSPSHVGRSHSVSMHLTTPRSSGDREADCMSNHSEINDYPAPRTMSSPTYIAYGDESPLSSSPPRQTTTRTKRDQYDESDEDSISAKPVKRIVGVLLCFRRSLINFRIQRTDETMSSPLRNSPAPRRATLASQKLSRKKLSAPFRSPLQTKTTSTQLVMSTSLGNVPQEPSGGERRAKWETIPNSAQEAPAGAQKTIKPLVRSSKAATQFRSPLAKAPERASRPIVLPNQTILNLERKLTILRRAIKIKRDGDEDHLKRLAKKWRDAGREAAYELWGIVRDLSTEGGEREIRGNGSDARWGWDKGERGTFGEDGLDGEGGGYGEKHESTLGIMLRELGIAPETLGWNDEEEAFVDDECE
ncbi:hypothetical protein BJV74DRAFT_566752 [Russula compacta]|nr:hypothetical protein BJV74DRAFT_566752 [Russula compacta]